MKARLATPDALCAVYAEHPSHDHTDGRCRGYTDLRVTTSGLRPGDVVHAAGGMFVRIPPEGLTNHGPLRTSSDVYACRGDVVNPDHVRRARVVPWTWLTEGEADGLPRWTIQGNDWAHWTISRPNA